MSNYFKLAFAVGISQAAGLVGSFFTVNSINDWYVYLNKPSFAPPNWLFAPAWITLYSLMGISLWLVWRKASQKPDAKKAMIVFFIHLFFNMIWSVIFFGLHNIGLALADILVIWAMIVIMIRLFWPIDKKAAWLLLPYLVWVSFASALNFFIWKLN